MVKWYPDTHPELVFEETADASSATYVKNLKTGEEWFDDDAAKLHEDAMVHQRHISLVLKPAMLKAFPDDPLPKIEVVGDELVIKVDPQYDPPKNLKALETLVATTPLIKE